MGVRRVTKERRERSAQVMHELRVRAREAVGVVVVARE